MRVRAGIEDRGRKAFHVYAQQFVYIIRQCVSAEVMLYLGVDSDLVSSAVLVQVKKTTGVFRLLTAPITPRCEVATQSIQIDGQRKH